VDIFADLEAEHDRLEAILMQLDDEQWLSPSGAPGWTISDVVLHLAQTDEAVIESAREPVGDEPWRTWSGGVDEAMAVMVREDESSPEQVFERWRQARRGSVVAMRGADPNRRLRWAAAPLRPVTLATTRLAEHWAHGLDITEPLGIEFPDTDRLRHIAWLGHSTLPYAFGLDGLEAQPVYCELTGPAGDTWTFGDAAAPSRIVGSAGEFCRVGAKRLAPQDSNLSTSGPHAADALRRLRNYAN
jgi:uncharacterized protein (TIGR03084 family)